MQHLDLQVVEQARRWLNAGDTLWLCTVLSTFGSSPREPGSLLVARADGRYLGSLSGGCVEEDFLERLQAGEFRQPVQIERYGAAPSADREQTRPALRLPCGGILEVLVERLEPNPANRQHLNALLDALRGQQQFLRRVALDSGERSLQPVSVAGERVELRDQTALIRIGPARRLILAGLSSVARPCAEFAAALGFEVIVCEPRDEESLDFHLPGVRLERCFPARFIAEPGNVHPLTAIVALTHDPRIDDLAMIEAVRTDAFYIGVMGSRRTSDQRASRLLSSGGLSPDQVASIHMPIGLALGSKTPAEIALAVLADILRVQRGIARNAL